MLTHTIQCNGLNTWNSGYEFSGAREYCLSLPLAWSCFSGDRRMYLPQKKLEFGSFFSISERSDWTAYSFAAGPVRLWKLCISVVAQWTKRLVRFRKIWDRAVVLLRQSRPLCRTFALRL